MSIEIYDSKEFPFGHLSNNSIYVMEINGQTYNTVTNYIYSNLINSKDYFNVLKNISVDNIHEYFAKYDKEITNNIVINALHKAIKIQFQNKKLEDLLLSTENYPIVYNSEDTFFGINKVGLGQNILGKYLTTIRTELSKKIESQEKKLYKVYVALQILEKLIKYNNIDLSDFIGLSIDEIINKYILVKARIDSKIKNEDLSKLKEAEIIEKYKNVVEYPSQNIVELLSEGDNIKILKSLNEPLDDTLKNQDVLSVIMGDNIKILHILQESLNNPYVLVLYAQQNNIRKLREMQQVKIKNDIFSIYMDHLLEKNFPTLDKTQYQNAKNSTLVVTDSKEVRILKDQTLSFYYDKLLPPKVMNIINKTVDFSQLVTEEYVQKIEKLKIEDLFTKNRGQHIIKFNDYDEESTNPYSVFSPQLYIEMLKIDNNYYPTVMHYIIANLLAALPGIDDINNAHNYLVFDMFGDVKDNLNYDSYDKLRNLYQETKYDTTNNEKKRYASIGLNKKFENIGLRELLLATENKRIIWNDNLDDILGEGFSKGGENFIGTYLGDLRKKFKNIDMESIDVTEKDIGEIIGNDIFMRSWLEMRLKDICKIVKDLKNYMVIKHNLNDKDMVEAKYNKRWRQATVLGINTNGTYIVKFNNGVVENQVPQSSIKISTGEPFQIDLEFINNILDNIYQPCKELMKDIKYIKTEPPIYFITLAQECFGTKINPEIITILWKRIIIMIFVIVKQIPKLKNIKMILTKIELLVSDKKKCVNIINNNDDNCIVSAIINLLKGMIEINNIYEYDTNVSKIDIETAIRIILNKHNIKLPTLDIDTYYIPDIDDNILPSIDEDILVEPNVISDTNSDISDYSQYMDVSDSDDNDIGDDNTNNYLGDFQEDEDGMKNILNDNKEFIKQKTINKINLYLDSNDITSKSNRIIAEYIYNAVNLIKKYKLSKKTKWNRINFFATTL